MIINAGLKKVVTRKYNGDIVVYYVKDWITHEDMDYGLEPPTYTPTGNQGVPDKH